jgi:hypothetical protein
MTTAKKSILTIAPELVHWSEAKRSGVEET